MKNSGVFAVGKDAVAAIQAAVMIVDVARTVFYDLQLDTPDEIPPKEVEQAHQCCLKDYGQS